MKLPMPKIVKTILKVKNSVGGFTLSDFNMHIIWFQSYINEDRVALCKNRHR